MDKYISCEAVFKAIKQKERHNFPADYFPDDEYAFNEGLVEAMNAVDEIPTADVVPVVRCGECENWQSGWKPSAAKDGTHFCANVGLCTSADWFCADGARMDGDEE